MHVDGSIFKDIEEKWLHFKQEPQNCRLSLAANDVNTFGGMIFFYLVWPIFVINNNLPPWISIKSDHIILEIIDPSILLFYCYLYVIKFLE